MSHAALSIKPIRGASLRSLVFARDGGVCARCGRDTEPDRQMLDAVRLAAEGSRTVGEIYGLTLKALGLKVGQKLWEADHVRPLSEGGDHSVLNMRTLCTYGDTRCHQAETKDLRARLKRKPNAARALARKERRARKDARR